MKKSVRRTISLLLSLAMLWSIVSAGALVAQDETPETPEGVEDQAGDLPLAPDTEEGWAEEAAARLLAEDGEYEIYPTPRSAVYESGVTVTLPATLNAVYGEGLDAYTRDRAVEAFRAAGVTLRVSSAPVEGEMDLLVGVQGSGDAADAYFRSHAAATEGLFDKHDAYRVLINADGVAVLGKDTDAAFYGLTTVKHILNQVGSNRVVKAVAIEDYADIPLRGTIEGYYGTPWSWEDRMEIMRFGGEFKSNIYIYAPKDDPYHNSQWRTLYPEAELANIRAAARAGNESKCYFGYALHPFMHNAVRFDTDAHYAEDLGIIKAKFTQVMDAGVRQLVLLADDAGSASTDNIKRLMGDLTEWVSSEEIQTAYPGMRTTIPFCPSDYGGTNTTQLQGLSDMTAKSPLIMTGGGVWGTVANTFIQNFCNAIYPTTASDTVTAEQAAANADKGPFFWINWPCNDNGDGKKSLALGGAYHYLTPGVTQENISRIQGLVINCMQLSEASKTAEFMVAQYGWKLWATSDEAEAARADSYDYVDHGTAVETPASRALHLLADNNINLGRSNSSIVMEESKELSPKLAAFRTKLDAGTLTREDIAAMRTEFEALHDAAVLYSTSGGNQRLVDQLQHFLPTWVESTQAALDLLDALDALKAGNGDLVVKKYLEGQGNLTKSRNHYFYHKEGDAGTYVAAQVGTQYIRPFIDRLMEVVSQEAKTIIDPTVLIATIITNRTDTPTGGLAAMRDGKESTVAVFQTPNSIAEGEYVGLEYNRVFALNRVCFKTGAANAHDTFNGCKLQYLDGDGQWQDIPGATFTNADTTLEATGLNLQAKGVRVIATEERNSTWLGIKEIYVNDEHEAVPDAEGPLEYTLIRTSGWTIHEGAEANLSDGDDSTLVWYNDGQNSPVGDYIGADLGTVVPVGAVRFLMDGRDRWSRCKIQYSTDNTSWTDYNNGQVFTTAEVTADLGGVRARYVRLVNQEATAQWLKFYEITIMMPPVVNRFNKVIYQSDGVGLTAETATGALADNSASLTAASVTLPAGGYVGIQLPRIRELSAVTASTLPAGVVVELGMNEQEMAQATLPLGEHVNARYVRVRNTGDASVTLTDFSLTATSHEVTGVSLVSATHTGTDGEPSAWFDGDLNTTCKFNGAQASGDEYVFDLGQTRTIKSLEMITQDANLDYPRTGVLEISADNVNWTDVVTFTTNVAADADFDTNALGAGTWTNTEGAPNFVSQKGTLDIPQEARYLRLRLTGASERWLKLNEIRINGGEYVPLVNDPTFAADPIEVSGDFTPQNLTDGDLTTGFRPNMTGRTEGSLTYRLSDKTDIDFVNIIQDSASISGATVTARVSSAARAASEWITLGTLTEAMNRLYVPTQYSHVYEVKIAWGNVTPTFYEVMAFQRGLVPVDKARLQALVDEVGSTATDGYPAEAVTAFTNALTAARDVLASANAGQGEVNSAYETLHSAYQALVVSALRELVLDTTMPDSDADKYSAAAWTAFQNARKAAQALLSKDAVTKQEADEAYEALRSAYDALLNTEPEGTEPGSETVHINAYAGADTSILFTENWKFNLGDASGANGVNFNDSDWRTVNLPHDYSIEQDYTTSGEAESGYLPGGVGWYRKSFTVSPAWEGKVVTVDFGGVYMDCEVYLNGTKLGEHHYGYTPFSFVLTGLNYSGENILAVKTDNPVPTSRWYSGSGIYRDVYLTVSEPVHVARYGTYVTTTNAGAVTVKTTVENSGAADADVTVKQEIFELDGATYEPKTAAVAETTSTAATSVAAGATADVTQTLNVASPKLWDSWDKGTPNLYQLKTTVLVNGTATDTYTTEFGFREIGWDVDNGFKLNGQYVKLKGVCQHHDQGALGSEAWYRAMERQVEILRDMGCNAIRVTHNPAADELIEICNRKGMLVIDEAFDGWSLAKNDNSRDFARWFNVAIAQDNALVGKKANEKWHQFVWETMIHRDKNAPSVILYSMGNEVQEGAGFGSDFVTIAQNLIEWATAIDSTRKVTRGDNSRTYQITYDSKNNISGNSDKQLQINQAIADAGGVVGFNYASEGVVTNGHNKGWVMYGSETVSAINSRGVYDNKVYTSNRWSIAQNAGIDRLTSYDKNSVGWGTLASDAWWRTVRYDYNAGEFVWTGFDYIGEPTPWNNTAAGQTGNAWPKSSFFGIVDTNGIPKDSYYLYRSMWNESDTTLHVLPTWDEADVIKDANGKVEVVVYSNAPVVKVLLNGTVVGVAAAEEHTSGAGHTYRTYSAGNMTGTNAFKAASGHQSLYATFDVTYETGTLEVKAYEADGATEITDTVGRKEVHTTTGAAKLVLTRDRDQIKNDGRDLSYITIDVTDAAGRIVNAARNDITVRVEGDGVLVGLDNGVQSDHTSYLASHRTAGAGQLVAIVQSTKTSGSFTVTAAADGLTPGSVQVSTGGAVSDVSPDTPVSYDIVKSYYVQQGAGKPSLPTQVTVRYADGSATVETVTWNAYDLPTQAGKSVVVAGIIGQGKLNLPVSVAITVLGPVAALLNYSAAIQVGGTPLLPAARNAVMADGAVTSAQFPVKWDLPGADAFARPGTVTIPGTAQVFDRTMNVTATIRVAQGAVVVGGDVIGDVSTQPGGFTIDGQDNTGSREVLDRLRDGGTDTAAWTGPGTLRFAYDTAQNFYKIIMTYTGTAPDSGDVTITLDDGQVTAVPTVSGSVATYDLGGIHSSTGVEMRFAGAAANLAEVALIVGTANFPIHDQATLDSLKVNGVAVTSAQLAAKTVDAVASVAVVEPGTTHNAAVTLLPEHDGVIPVIVEAEDHSARNTYLVRLGAPAPVEATDASRDYPYGQTTVYAPSEQGGNPDGPDDNTIDNNIDTYWHSKWGDSGTRGHVNAISNKDTYGENWIELTLQSPTEIVALRQYPRKNSHNGRIKNYQIRVSTTDGLTDAQWLALPTVAEGAFTETPVDWQIAMLNKAVTAKYVRLYATGSFGDVQDKDMAIAELRVVKALPGTDLSRATVAVNGTDVTVTLNGTPLTAGTEYTVRTDRNAKGETYVYADGVGNYYGTANSGPIVNTITGIETVTLSVLAGETPQLPATVTAHMKIGEDVTMNVTWGAYTAPEAPNKSAIVYGAVEGTAQKAMAVVTVVSPVSVDGVSAVTSSNVRPKLPTEVTVQFDNGTHRTYPVTWDWTGVDLTTEGTTVRVPGTVTGLTIPATANVRVANLVNSDVNIALNDSEKNYTGSGDNLALNSVGSIFPMALAYWSSGNNNPYQAIQGNQTADTDLKNRWSDWERGNVLHATTWLAVAFETSTENVTAQQSQTLTLVPHIVNRAKIMFVDESGGNTGAVTFPQTYKLQYYTGPVENLTFDTRTSHGDNAFGNGRVRAWTNSPLNNDSNWTDVTVTGSYPAVPTSNGQMLTVEFTPVPTAILRILCTAKTGTDNHWVGVEEFEVMEQVPQKNSIFTATINQDGNAVTGWTDDGNGAFHKDVEVTGAAVPQVTATATNNASVSVKQATSLPGSAVVTVTSEDGSNTETYTLNFTQAAAADYPVDTTQVGAHLTVSTGTANVAPGATVTLTADTGYALESVLVTKSGDAAVLVPVSEGAFTMPSYPVTVIATAAPVRYTITYVLDGGVNDAGNPAEYTIEDRITLQAPTREGYTFTGWTYEGQTTPATDVTIPAGSTGDKTFTANWAEAQGYAITTSGRVRASANTAFEGQRVTLTAAPGYTLSTVAVYETGNESNTVPVTDNAFTMPAYPVTVTGTVTATEYRVSYDLAGGAVEGTNPTTYTIEQGFTLVNPTRAGYTFAGWTGTGLTGATGTVTVPVGSVGHRSYTATWTELPPEEFNVTTTGVAQRITVTGPTNGKATAGTVITLTPYPGYQLADVAVTGPEGEVDVTDGQFTMPEGAVTVTATVTAIEYEITYVLDGGANALTNPTSYTVEQGFTLTAPTKEGYTFTGWTYGAVTTPAASVTIPAGSVGELTFTAHWTETTVTPGEHTVTLPAGGKLTATPASAAAGTTVTISVQEGYAVSGLTVTGPDGDVTVTNNQFTMPNGDVTVTATVTAIEYPVTYNLDGGTNAGGNPATYTVEQSFTLAEPTRDGYTFTGWTYGTVTTPTKSVTIARGTTGSLEFTAHWTATTVTPGEHVVNLPADGKLIATPATAGAGDTVTISVRPGYTIDGLTVVGPDGLVPVTDNQFTMPDGDVTVTGTVSAIIYQITYVLGGGTNAAGNPTSYTVESDAFTLQAPSKSGSTFLGWTYGSVTTPDKNVTIAQGSTGNITFTANWSANGGGSTGGGGGGVSVTPGDKVTTTTQREEDGSTTTVAVNETTGSVTTTVTEPDGVVVVSATDAEGQTTGSVSLPRGMTEAEVTILTPEEPTAGTVAVLVDPDGTETILMDSLVTPEGVRVTLTDGAQVKLVDNTKDFIDVPDTFWADAAITYVASRELFQGTAPHIFTPNGAMSRAMAVTVLARLAGEDTTGGATWYEKGLTWAKEQNVSDGTNPDENVSREQLVVMLYRYAGSPEADDKVLYGYADGAQVSAWARAAMSWAIRSHIIQGKGSGLLDPTGNATRAEVSAIFQRFIQR